MKGGYKIINFEDANLTAENPITINGIYEAVEHNYRKPLLLAGLVIDGVEKSAVYATATATENLFTFSVYGKTITVKNTDEITIA